MQVEIQPPRLDEALSLVEEVAAAQSADAAMSGQVLLQRRYRPSNLELISVWSSSEAFEEHLAPGSAQATRSALASRLVAPIDVRRHRVFAGGGRPRRLPDTPPHQAAAARYPAGAGGRAGRPVHRGSGGADDRIGDVAEEDLGRPLPPASTPSAATPAAGSGSVSWAVAQRQARHLQRPRARRTDGTCGTRRPMKTSR
jgi:hypothetical protein